MTVYLRIDAADDPEALPRIVGSFGRLSLTPSRVAMRLRRNGMRIDVRIKNMDERQAEILAARLRESVLVTKVALALD